MRFKAGIEEAVTWNKTEDDCIGPRADMGFGAEFSKEGQVAGTDLFEQGF